MKSFLKFATRPDNLVLVICLCLFAAVVAHGENGPTPKIVVGSSGISDGSVTNAKLSEPVAIEKGGTSKTTAAEALAALGGASLNGSSTVAFNAQSLKTPAQFALSKNNLGPRGIYSVETLGTIATHTVCTVFLPTSTNAAAIDIKALVCQADGAAGIQTVRFTAVNNSGTINIIGATSSTTVISGSPPGMKYQARVSGTTLYVDVAPGSTYLGLSLETTVSGYFGGASGLIVWP